METNLRYVKGICKKLTKTNESLVPEINQNQGEPFVKETTWYGFLRWTKDRLT